MPSAPLLALALLSARGGDADVTQAEIDAAIDKGVQRVLQHFADGMGRRDATGRSGPEIVDHPGLRALVAYTLARSGIPPEHAVVERLLARIAFERVDKTYDRACLLMALEATHPVGQRAWIEDLTKELVDSQAAAGDWGYPDGGDLSNTQFAALALRASAAAGVPVPAEIWKRLARAVLEYVTHDGGFGYVDSARKATGSMTAAGIGTLAICESELAECGALDPELESDMRAARATGIAWLTKAFSVERNPGNGGWLHYYLYGMERVGALSGVEHLGPHDWYREGAANLVATQDDGGDWPGTFAHEGTLFALLFLRRATAPRPLPKTAEPGEKTSPVEAAIASGPVWFALESERPLRLAIDGFAAAERARLEWPGESGRGLHVLRVEYLAGEDVIAVALGDPTRPAGSQRHAREITGLARGKHGLRARVHVQPPPAARRAEKGAPVETVVLESRVLAIEVGDEPGARGVESPLPRLDPANAMGDGAAKAAASTVLARPAGFEFVEFEPRLAVDGNLRTPWIARPGDSAPVLRLTLRKPQRADRVRVHAARLVPRSPGFLAVPREVHVRINGADAGRIDLAAVPGASRSAHGDLVLDAPRLVTAIELRLVPPADAKQAVGIGEVELLLGGG